MITVDEAARLLSGELEDCIALLGNRLVGGGLGVESVRVAIGQSREVADDESFLLTEGHAGRAGWAVEVRVHATDAPPEPSTDTPSGSAGAPVPLDALTGRSCTVLRGTDDDTARALAGAGVRSVEELALLPETRLTELRDKGGLRLLESWSKAQLLRLPLPPGPWGGLGGLSLAELAGMSPARLRASGLPADVSDSRTDELARILALLGAALDVSVLRALTLDHVASVR